MSAPQPGANAFDIHVQDGFQEYFSFHEHRLSIKGFNLVDHFEDRNKASKQQSYLDQCIVSWDVKHGKHCYCGSTMCLFDKVI